MARCWSQTSDGRLPSAGDEVALGRKHLARNSGAHVGSARAGQRCLSLSAVTPHTTSFRVVGTDRVPARAAPVRAWALGRCSPSTACWAAAATRARQQKACLAQGRHCCRKVRSSCDAAPGTGRVKPPWLRLARAYPSSKSTYPATSDQSGQLRAGGGLPAHLRRGPHPVRGGDPPALPGGERRPTSTGGGPAQGPRIHSTTGRAAPSRGRPRPIAVDRDRRRASQLGIAVGRLVWRAFATDLGVLPIPVVTVWVMVAVASGTLIVANVLAIGPALVASRSNPASLLKAE